MTIWSRKNKKALFWSLLFFIFFITSSACADTAVINGPQSPERVEEESNNDMPFDYYDALLMSLDHTLFIPLYSEPTIQSRMIGEYYTGQSIKLFTECDGWSFVEVVFGGESVKGYAENKYVTLDIENYSRIIYALVQSPIADKAYVYATAEGASIEGYYLNETVIVVLGHLNNRYYSFERKQ